MPKTEAITSCAGKGAWRSSEWRMRSSSDAEWDNITHLERGPQGSGGLVKGQGLVPGVESTPVVETRSKAGVNALGYPCLPGIRRKGVCHLGAEGAS
jgi:hypothetical protein